MQQPHQEKDRTSGDQKEKNSSDDRNAGIEGRESRPQPPPPPLMALNHVSRLCKSVKDSVDFYVQVLGFVLVDRPQAFDFDGAWLFNYGIGVHLVQARPEDELPNDTDNLDPMDNHISFECEDIKAMEERLKDHNTKYMKRAVDDEEHGTSIDQLFFKDPDGHMIEICNCENLKLVPAGSIAQLKLPTDRHVPPVELGKKYD